MIFGWKYFALEYNNFTPKSTIMQQKHAKNSHCGHI